MKNKNEAYVPSELDILCSSVRTLVMEGNFDSSVEAICRAMEKYPHSPEPHNLMGIVLEKTGDHLGAMKHFRAAWALDPGYLPANHNLSTYGTFFSNGVCAFDESDLPRRSSRDNSEIVYDSRGVGRVVRKNEIKYDEHGIGHVVRRHG